MTNALISGTRHQVCSTIRTEEANMQVRSISMSRKGDCFDNAVVESFFASLKREECDRAVYPTRDIARQDVFAHLEQFYNRKRRHSYLGYVSPVKFEAEHPASLRRIA